MKECIRKLVHFLIFYPIYYMIWFTFLGKELLKDPLILFIIIFYFSVNFIDILIRPMSDPNELKDKYTIIVLSFFLSGPLIFILAFTENQILVSTLVPFYDSLITSIFGIFFMLFGAVVLLVSRYQLNQHTYGGGSLSEDVDQSLLTSGMYKNIRHPIYTGGFIMTLGLQLAFRSILMLLFHASLYFLIFKGRMNREEEILQSKFGEMYIEYMDHTYRLIPYIY